MTSMTFSPNSSPSVKSMCSQINCLKATITNSLKAETVKNTRLVRLSAERIRHLTAGDQTKIITNGLDGRVSKRYKERLNMNLSMILKVNMRENSCNLRLKYLQTYNFKVK